MNIIQGCRSCSTSIEDCVNSRRCFITGEYCSKQTNIQRERKRLHAQKSINAFVIMNFSDMSDVMYKWRIKSFIESLKKNLYLNFEKSEIMCWASVETTPGSILKDEKWVPVEEIKVIRADSNPVSNYVICNRVCQQMQIADLVIVDVSTENTNVFYEFGMAVALGKMILPICYSESLFYMSLPSKAKEYKSTIEHHIGCYPWRKELFEYYGIRYRSKSHETYNTEYERFEDVTNEIYGFKDVQYNCFPYDEVLEGEDIRIGEQIYNRLRDSYNQSGYDENTLVVYTMDGILNGGQAGQCIVNFYCGITEQMKKEHCFCGDRVGVLVQLNAIPDEVKDSRVSKHLLYRVGEIIHIGMNQATYTAQKEMIKTQDFLCVNPDFLKDDCKDVGWKEDIIRFVKEHIRNKGILIYPNDPVYVNRVKNGLQKNILEAQDSNINYYCLYHIMLKTLKLTNEIVVDISGNSLQALFWLGAAHASDIYAITVRHEISDAERRITSEPTGKERNIFDVAGLWTATLRSYDTDGFYHQLALAQLGIEQHTKLMLKNVDYYEESLRDHFYEECEPKAESSRLDTVMEKTKQLFIEKENQEAQALESYYRDRFWKPMLRYNRLRIYLSQMSNEKTDRGGKESEAMATKWDVDVIATFSHYLSKRKMIGEYHFKMLAENETDDNAQALNFICVGDDAQPLPKGTEAHGEQKKTISLAEYISQKTEAQIYKTERKEIECNQGGCEDCKTCQFQDCKQSIACPYQEDPAGKVCAHYSGEANKHIIKSFVQIGNGDKESPYHSETGSSEQLKCASYQKQHSQLAQLILWREVPETEDGRVYYRVSLAGESEPAVLALSSILVDEEQKQEILFGKAEGDDVGQSEGKAENYMLSRLQAHIREELTKKYIETLNQMLGQEDIVFHTPSGETHQKITDELDAQRESYFDRVRYAACTYLSTVFYRYFLPFLSREDEYRICTGMQTFVTYMMAAEVSPFALNYPHDGDSRYISAATQESVKNVIIIVSKALKQVLESFRGVEAMYQVKMMSTQLNQDAKNGMAVDSRGVEEIDEFRGLDGVYLNCIFV